MQITPATRKLVRLVEQAHQGELCLPEFQRDFVWPREQVADLVRSMLRGYYVGSLLLLDTDPNNPPFQPAFLRGAEPKQAQPHPKQLVLDGQQRLTSLMYALTAPNYPLKDTSRRRYFFVDLQKAVEDIDSDDIILSFTDRELVTEGLKFPETQFERRLLPCTALINPTKFSDWSYALEDWLRDHQPTEVDDYRKVWRPKWGALVNGFLGFDAAVIELPQVSDADPDALGRVCAIFEKLNSSGVELSVYDLLTSRLYRSQIKLHDLWDEACKQHPRLNRWSNGKADTLKFGVQVLRVLALLRGLTPTPKELIRLNPDAFQQDWQRAAAGLERALEVAESISQDGFGVFEPQWLPGTGLLAVLAAGRQIITEQKLAARETASLRRWYWCSVFLERYSSGVDSKARKDFSELLTFWQGGSEPSVFQEAHIRIGAPGYTVRNAASSYSAVYSGIFCLLALQGARDWRKDESLTLHDVEDHHIFPKAYLKRAGITRRTRVNSVLNRTLVSDSTNRMISDKTPGTYMEMSTIFPHGATDEGLALHFLASAAREHMREAEENLGPREVEEVYEAFLTAREAQILTAIRHRCGVSVQDGT